MKIFQRILRILLFLTTAIWGLLVNTSGALTMITNEEMSMTGLGYAMLAANLLGFILPTVLIMLRKTKWAAGLSVAGSVALFIIYAQFTAAGGPSAVFFENHMPSVFITIIIVLLAIISNLGWYHAQKKRKLARENAPAPSIFERRDQ